MNTHTTQTNIPTDRPTDRLTIKVSIIFKFNDHPMWIDEHDFLFLFFSKFYFKPDLVIIIIIFFAFIPICESFFSICLHNKHTLCVCEFSLFLGFFSVVQHESFEFFHSNWIKQIEIEIYLGLAWCIKHNDHWWWWLAIVICRIWFFLFKMGKRKINCKFDDDDDDQWIFSVTLLSNPDGRSVCVYLLNKNKKKFWKKLLFLIDC